MRNEMKAGMPLRRSLTLADQVTARPANIVSPLNLERIQREAVRRFVTTVDDPESRIRMRADTFSAHLKRFLEAGGSELLTAANDRQTPHVASMVSSGLKDAGKAPLLADSVNAASIAMKEAFAEATQAINGIYRKWAADGMDTPEARERIQNIGMRMHQMGQSAVVFLGKVGDASGVSIGSQARTEYETFMQVTDQAVSQLTAFEAKSPHHGLNYGPRR